MLYFGHYEERAVCRDDENGNCYAKLWTSDRPGHYYLTEEYPLGKDSDIRLGNPDYQSIPFRISKEEYDTFGTTWTFARTPEEGTRAERDGNQFFITELQI